MDHYIISLDDRDYILIDVGGWSNSQHLKELINRLRDPIWYFEHSYYSIFYIEQDGYDRAINYYIENEKKERDQIDDHILFDLGEFLND